MGGLLQALSFGSGGPVKTITGKLTRADGTPIGGVAVTVRLSSQAIVASTQEVAPTRIATTTASDGTWTIGLQANGDLTPSSTYYTFDLGEDFEATAIVPQTAGPFKFEDIVSPAPNAAPPTFNSGATFAAGTVTFAVSPSFNAGATIKQLVFLRPPSGSDDTAVINAAISVPKNHVIASGGSYRTSAGLTPASGVTLEGLGFSAELNNANYPQWNPATEIKWNNSTGAPMIVPPANTSGVTIRNLGLDGNAQATKGFYGDRLNASVIENVGVRNLAVGANAVALHLAATNNAVNQNASRNRITGFYFMADEGIRLTGSNPGAYGVSDCCHNLFEHISGSFGNATNNNNGVTLVDSDNNTFIDFFLYRNSGTGYGVDFQAGARGEYFFHLQASLGGVHAGTPYSVGHGNVIFGYDRENGQPLPVVDAGALLDWTESGSASAGWAVRGFQGSISHGSPQTAVPSNAGGLVYHIQHDGTTVKPELRIEGTANSSFADFNMYGKDAGGAAVRGRLLLSGPGGAFELGSVTNHVTNLRANNQIRQKLLGAGGTQFMDAAGTTVEAAIGVTGKLDTYATLTTAGMGVPPILSAAAPTLGLTGAASNLAQITTPNDSAKHIYLVTAFCRISVLGSASFSLEVTYTDTGGSAKTTIIPVCAQAGTYGTVANTADTYSGSVVVSANPNTTITVLTAGTFTGVTYAAGGEIVQIL